MGNDTSIGLEQAASQVKEKYGRKLLDKEDMLLLMADAISRTTTFEELRFLQPESSNV